MNSLKPYLIPFLLGIPLSFLASAFNFTGYFQPSFIWHALVYSCAAYFVVKKDLNPILTVVSLMSFLTIGLLFELGEGLRLPMLFTMLASFYLAYTSAKYKQGKQVNKVFTSLSLLLLLSVSLYFPSYCYDFFHRKVTISFPNSAQVIALNDKTSHFPTDKTLLLEFWDTRCGACIEAYPYLQEIHDYYKSDSNMIVASMASAAFDSLDRVKDFEYLKPFSFPQYYEKTGKLNEALGIKLYPQFVLIDKGQVKWIHEGFAATKDVKRIFVSETIKEIEKARGK